VLAPLLVIWFGSGNTPRVTIAALAVFFVVLVNVVRGLKAVTRERQEIFMALGAGRAQVLWHLRIPSALPYLLSALKIAAVGSLFGAVIGEWVGANRGLGVALIFALYQFQTDRLWAAMVLITAVALVFYVAVSLSERVLIPWHESVRRTRLEIER
jgi:NitT/TauT family transport system permease protein